MASSMLEEMFSDTTTPRDRGDRFEALKSAFKDSIDRHDRREDAFIPASRRSDPTAPVGIIKGAGPGAPRKRGVEGLERLAERFSTLSKGLSESDAATVAADLAALNALKSELNKDISTTVPGNLHPYDLEGPAKQLVPRFTPLRNDIPRQRGQGTAREYRRILGYTNTGFGGVPDQTPFFNSETALNGGSTAGLPTFGGLSLIRGKKISYAMDVHTIPYMEMSLSSVTGWKAQFANLGFEDSRALDQMALLWGHLLGEEKALLWGRGSNSIGYAGAVAAPAVGTVTAAAGSTALPAGSVFVKVTSYTGMGESLPAAEKTVTVTAGQSLVIPITPVAGALSYGVYVGTATNAETFQGFFLPQAGGASAGSILFNQAYSTTGRVVPAADGSFSADAYDGLITALISGGTVPVGGGSREAAGFVGYFPTLYSGVAGGASIYNPALTSVSNARNVGDEPFQNMWAAMYANNYADPEELWVTAVQRRQLADFLRSQPNAGAYRINMDNSGFAGGGVEVGGFVNGIANESSPTNRILNLRVHPYMPTGVAFTRTCHLPIPDSGIADTTVITEVQGYMSVDWPEMQFTYDSSTYWYGTAIHYAPAWNGIIYGLQ
jgi:hypothetical protein